ncbi:MAG: glycosyltransferase family 9 protein [Bacteriovoracaceae bacterium]|nr:glycosyltransferase family 9 protein [Bacteriovoracaceae bacterium]
MVHGVGHVLKLIKILYIRGVKQKILIIRFSSFGDIVQAMSVLKPLKVRNPDVEIHWLTRSEFSSLVGLSSYTDKIISFDKSKGFIGLIKLGLSLRKEGYKFVFDAHKNTRSFILRLLLLGVNKVIRPKSRWKRFLLFKLRINKFPWPFKGMKSYLSPLSLNDENLIQEWEFPKDVTLKIDGTLPFEDFIAIAPSAAWEMKRWPLDHWKNLIRLLPNENFVVLGGPADTFCEELSEIDSKRVVNLAGHLSLIESCYTVSKSKTLVSADTGLIHVADILGIKGISLVGPTAFGFSTNKNIKTLEVDLSCRPCSKDGRGNCSQAVWQKCMVDIRPETVIANL